MLVPIITPCTVILLVVSSVANAYQRAEEHRAAKGSADAISGFVGFYYDYETPLNGLTFPVLAKKPLPLPGYVYELVPSEFLHNVVAVEVILPDDTLRELVPLSRWTSLKALSVTWARYSDADLRHFEQFRGLEYLELSHSFNLTDRGLPKLAVLENLKVLRISGDGISESGIELLRSKMPNCTINGRMARRDPAEPRTTEQMHAPEPAAGPASNGESSPPAR